MWKISGGNGTDKDINLVVNDYLDNDNKYSSGDVEKDLLEEIMNDARTKFYDNEFANAKNNVFVYLATIADVEEFELINNPNNKQNINTENKVIKQGVAGYNLLKYTVKDVWGIDEDLSNIKLSPNGKPYTDKYKFSISHCNGLVCVAISDKEVGVDLECETTQRKWDRLSRRVLTKEEKENINTDNKTMTINWTKKESVFKLLGDRVFSPSSIDISKYYTDTVQDIFYLDNFYTLSIASYEETANYLTIKRMGLLQEGWCFI